ncbi:MAG: hypothetical protein ACLR2M_02440 [Varibaculum sp.]
MDNSNDEKDALLSGDVDFALMGVPTVISQAAQDAALRSSLVAPMEALDSWLKVISLP